MSVLVDFVKFLNLSSRNQDTTRFKNVKKSFTS